MSYMDLKHLHKADLLHSLLVAMVTKFPQQQGYLSISIAAKNICAKYELEILSCCWVIAAFLCCHGYSGYRGSQVNRQYILSQGTYVPNMALMHKSVLSANFSPGKPPGNFLS